MIVNNNYSGGVGESSLFNGEVNFAKVAESMGCFGQRVDKPDQIRPALEKALASGRPAVVEVLTDPEVRAVR
jgi:acetolactate synthase-1/2/3 large subunit